MGAAAAAAIHAMSPVGDKAARPAELRRADTAGGTSGNGCKVGTFVTKSGPGTWESETAHKASPTG